MSWVFGKLRCGVFRRAETGDTTRAVQMTRVVQWWTAPGAVGGHVHFLGSQDDFDQWFKGQIKEDIAGVDLNVPPPVH